MQLWSKQNLTGATLLVVALMTANFLNFVFNAFLGRHLEFEQFGILTFFNTVISLIIIFFAGLSSTVNHRTAYLNGKYGHEAGALFTKFVRNKSLYAAGACAVLWAVLSPFISNAFRIDDVIGVLMFTPVFVFATVVMVNKGYLQGNLNFVSVAIIVLAEALMKLMAAAALIFLGFENWVYLSIPFSFLCVFVLSSFLTLNKLGIAQGVNHFRFPKRFYSAAVVTGLSSAVFLSVDVLLAKYYLDPVVAGEYSLLSLVGKMVYFLGSLLNGFMITFVSHDSGEHKDPSQTFRRLFTAALVLTTLGVVAVGQFGYLTVPILLGDKALNIIDFLPIYTLAIGLFTVASSIVTYHLAREHYSFSVASLALSLLMGVGIIFNHDSIGEIVNVIFYTSVTSVLLISFLHAIQKNTKFILANMVDLLNLFKPLEKQEALKDGSKRILIMNWRDTKHSFAGGAEVYIHELAKRWVKDGNQVTWFCGNDGNIPHNETIDGIRIVRRGGFYFVYVWGFIYYLTKFRGRFDVIIDCQNGIPFFSPIYAKEKIYCLLFHVHQEVFNKYLPKPLAWFASVLENRAMPYVYKNVRFMTISESTKSDMERLDIKGKGIEVVFPGVDLGEMQPGDKNVNPTVLYLGRLKAYKSVDVLIRSFVEVVKKIENAKLLIAGSGEEEANLKALAADFGLDDNIEFLGRVTNEQKILLLQRAWVFVNPSLMEGWGITTIEANACGTPVVASDVPGLRDSVNNPHSGFLVSHGDDKALALKLVELLGNNELRDKMSANAFAWSQKFDWDHSAKKGLAVLYAKQA